MSVAAGRALHDGAVGWCDEHDAEIPAKWKDCRLAVHQAAAGYYGRIADCAPCVLGSDAAQAVAGSAPMARSATAHAPAGHYGRRQRP